MFVEAQMIADAPVLFNTVYIYNVKLLHKYYPIITRNGTIRFSMLCYLSKGGKSNENKGKRKKRI